MSSPAISIAHGFLFALCWRWRPTVGRPWSHYWTISPDNGIFSPQYPVGEGMLFPASSPSLPGIAKDALIRPMPGNSAFPILLAGSYKFTLL